uniref:hypothetical protein n=1 Tax=Eubacterium sp. TaxID=142586 RepID=UPI004024F07A
MKNKKLILISVIAVIVILTASFFVGTGFIERTDVILTDYSVSEDGTQITLNASVSSSMGYIRGFKNNGGGVKPHYLTFYSTFGGLNSKLGAKNEFVLEVNEDDSEIYFNRAGGGYELVLQKNTETGEWEKTP